MKKTIHHGVSSAVTTPAAEEVSQTPAAAVAPPTTTTEAASSTTVTSMNDPAVEQCISLLGQVGSLVGTVPALNADQVRRSTKMRKGGAAVVSQLLALCKQKGVTQIGSLTTKEMADQLARGDALVQVGKHSSVVQKQVREEGMNAHGRSWQIATTMYKTLQRMAVDDPETALGLEPVKSFFQTKKTKDKARADAKASKEETLAKETGGTAKGSAEPVAASPTPAPVVNGAPPPGVTTAGH